MKVKDLLSALENLPPDKEVEVKYIYDDFPYVVNKVELIKWHDYETNKTREVVILTLIG